MANFGGKVRAVICELSWGKNAVAVSATSEYSWGRQMGNGLKTVQETNEESEHMCNK